MSELEMLRQGGVVGGGGAGFPLWKKLSAPAEILLINGAECEPLLKSDQYLMHRYAVQLTEAASRLAGIVHAREAVICLKDHYEKQRAALQDALKQSTLNPPVRIHLLPTVYPIGDEQALVFSATGRTVPPGALPGSVGCTVVSVSTALNALRALEGKPVTDRFVTVAGEVRKPGVYLAPVGCSRWNEDYFRPADSGRTHDGPACCQGYGKYGHKNTWRGSGTAGRPYAGQACGTEHGTGENPCKKCVYPMQNLYRSVSASSSGPSDLPASDYACICIG